MKKCWIVLVMAAFLSGCGSQETFETVTDTVVVPVMAQMAELQVALPEEAAMPSMENGDTGKLYLCDGYTITVHTEPAGDLEKTLLQSTGFSGDRLTVMKTERGGIDRYECVWSAAGEGGDQVGRAVILNDGSYHYVVTVMADFSVAGELTEEWQKILDSVTLSTD